MDPMSMALRNRRSGGDESKVKVAQILESLGDDEKKLIFESLKMEMEAPTDEGLLEEKEDDGNVEREESGPINMESGQTSGEKEALSEEMSNRDKVMSALEDPRFKADDGLKPRNLGERVQMNIAKMKQK